VFSAHDQGVKSQSNQDGMKQQLRQQLQAQLSQVSFDQLIDWSGGLQVQFQQWARHFQSPPFHQKTLLSFYPFGVEPQIQAEPQTPAGPGSANPIHPLPFQLAYPRIVDWRSRLMEPHLARRDIPELWEEFEIPSGTRIFQPKAETQVAAVSEIAAVLVPGVGFNEQGHRLGRGAGFYDRFLARAPHALRIGIAFECQLVSNIPTDPHDLAVDIILTQNRLISTNRYSEWAKHGRINRE
jgi:5-formyltetrahydrofolate cyclo-ligase